MSFLFSLSLLLFLALIAYNVVTYLHATGSRWDRLAAAWKGSLTIFALVWASLVGLLSNGMDALSSITGDPKFADVGNAIKSAVPANYGQWIVIATLMLPLVAGSLGRMRTLNK